MILEENNINTTNAPKKSKLSAIDIVQKTKERFGKKESHLSKRLTTGDNIVLSSNPDDYIHSPETDKFWFPLTGIIGFPFGKIIQIAGKPDSGKSTAAMVAMKAAQNDGTLGILWDAEGKFDSLRFRDKIGGDPSQILVAPSRNITEGVRQVAAYVKTIKEMDPNQKIQIVWDSIGASINSTEDEENDDYSKQPGVTAKEVSWGIRRFNQLMEKYKSSEGDYTISILCINQVYANIGSVGNKQKGGGQVEYLSSLILEMSRKSTLTRIKNKQRIKYGILSIARVKKNHLFGGEDCVAELDLVVSSSGISLVDETKKKITDLEDED